MPACRLVIRKKYEEKNNFFASLMLVKIRVVSGPVSPSYGSADPDPHRSNIVFILANLFLFPTQDCVHQQAGQAGGGRLYDGDLNDAAAGDSSASHPDTAGPGSRVCIPNRKNVFRIPPFSDPDPTLKIHSESASYL